MSFQDLEAGVPKDNLTIVGLARQLAANIHHDLPADPDAAWAAKQRDILRGVVRFSPVTVTHAWPISATHEKTMESRGYRFEFSNGLSATGVFMESTVRQRSGGITLLIADAGKVAMIEEAGNDFDRGQRVLVMEPLFFGENVPGTTERPAIATNAQILNSVGERPLGLEAAQIVAVAQWLQKDLVSGSSTPGARIVLPTDSAAPVRVITSGRRSETTALVAAAIMPELFSSVEARDASETLGSLFTNPPNYDEAPELMCLDLYKDFDLNILGKVAAPVKISLLTKEAKSAPSQ
jgi:hypothetical protein